MKTIDIRFFSPAENNLPKAKKDKAVKEKQATLTGYISSAGRLVFPTKTAAGLGIDFENTTFKVGMQEGKRKAKSLYLVPASDSQDNTFQVEKAAKSYTLSLPLILKKSGVDFRKLKYVFTILLFEYEGTTAFELRLSQEDTIPKVAYTGKPRGRKPKSIE